MNERILADKRIYAWELLATTTNGVRVFFNRDGSMRSCGFLDDDLTEKLTIHTRRDGTQGTSSTEVDSSHSKSFQDELARMVECAEVQENPLYELVSGQQTVEVRCPEFSKFDLVERVKSFHGEILSAIAHEDDVRIAYLEVHLLNDHERYRNSRGVNMSQLRSRVYVELALLSQRNGREAEYTAYLNATSLSDIDPRAFVKQYAASARHALTDELPMSYTGPVLITGDAVVEMLGYSPDFFCPRPTFYHLNAKTLHEGKSRFKGETGVPLARGEYKGDKLTIISDPTLPGGTGSMEFGPDGTPAKKVFLVEDGIVKNYTADNRYSQLTRKDATGPVGNVVIYPGENDINQLVEEGCCNTEQILVVGSFSHFKPDPDSGMFSAEIRVARMYGTAGMRPVKGGTVSGNWFEVLGDVLLSKEIIQTDNYYGPKAVLFRNLTVTGK